jgi:hypothetical protein
MKVTGAFLALPVRDLGVMPRFQTDDNFDDDPAVARAGTAAMGLYYRCGVYVAGHLLDGFVPTEIASQYGTPEWAKKLTDVGLWETVPGGHFMPLYFAHGNPTREKVLAERKAKSQRQQRWLEKQRNPSSKQRRVSRPSNRPSSDPSRVASEDIALPPSLTGRKGHARAVGAAPRMPSEQRPPWCGKCDEATRLFDDDNPRRCPDCHPLTRLEAS